MANKNQRLYRISFYHQENTIYEIYARSVAECDMWGFLQVENFVFGENSSVVIDPSEERLKLEFSGVKRTYIPMQSVLRVDEVTQEGVARIHEASEGKTNISHFPSRPQTKE